MTGAYRNVALLHHSLTAGLLVWCLSLAACGTPVEVQRADARTVQTELTSNALTTGRLSGSTQIVLRRFDLLGVYADAPPVAIQALNQIAAAGDTDAGLLFALAEMAFLQAERTNARSYFLATVVYSYAFPFPDLPADRPNPFDLRLRTAADLYKRALTRGLVAPDGEHIDLRGGDFSPCRPAHCRLISTRARCGGPGRGLTNFVAASELHIEGLKNRYRETGIGAPLAADLVVTDDQRGFQVARGLKVSITALLRLDTATAAVASGRYSGRLMLYPGNEERMIEIGGQTVPLEIEPTAALAYSLSNPDIWKTEIAGFFRGDLTDKLPSQLVALEPYRPDRIAVVLVHGTTSSAGRWGDLVNDLQNDAAIRDRFQFWLFTYNTGNPVPLSALQLRDALAAAIKRLDPDGDNPALRHMVVIGHSQGGLLAKMLAVDAGSRLFDTFSKKPLYKLTLSSETREVLRRALFVTPMPEVGRVIFIATPHRGSFVAGGSLAQLVGRLIRLPLSVTKLATEALTDNRDAMRLDPDRIRFGSVYGMTPGSPFITTLSSIPVSPGIPAHSIIAVSDFGLVEAGDDGVVAYSSAHIDEAASELVISSGHSVQSNAKTVAEVRRILLLHWRVTCPSGCVLHDESPVGSATPVAIRTAASGRQ